MINHGRLLRKVLQSSLNEIVKEPRADPLL